LFFTGVKLNDHPDWRPTAEQSTLEARAHLLSRIREFFSARQVLEVETPLISGAGNSDPGIKQFSMRSGSLSLRTSPEYPMKRLLAAGSGDIYELGRVFRADENGRFHNAEFTLLEWYRNGWSYHQLMDEVAELIRFCIPEIPFRESRVAYRDLLMAYTNFDPLTCADEDIATFINDKGVELQDLNRGQMLDLVISHFVQTKLPSQTITFVYDYPSQQAALARIRDSEPPVAERFEMFLGQVELANGYQELTDACEQTARFESENTVRKAAGQKEVLPDTRLLAAMHSGLPDCAGVALGVDRLLMANLELKSIDSVLAFPFNRS
jgi:lysyl-tRNA synthetase class 2